MLAGVGKLRPCEHQVAGHLFEEGKPGSLVDDRGHFYKPIQKAPRGDRERDFYEAVAAALVAEEHEREREDKKQQIHHHQQQQQQQQQQLNGKAAAPPHPCCSSAPRPIQVKLVSVPSFRERSGPDPAVQIAQRDEFGLLGTPTLRDLREVGGEEWLGRSPDSEGAELTAEHLMDGFSLHRSSQQRQQQRQRHLEQQQQQQQQHSWQQGGSSYGDGSEAGAAPAVTRPPASLTDPRHAEVAAMLGQPIYDVELNQPAQPPSRRAHFFLNRRSPCQPSPSSLEGTAAVTHGPAPCLVLSPVEREAPCQPVLREAQPCAAAAAAAEAGVEATAGVANAAAVIDGPGWKAAAQQQQSQQWRQQQDEWQQQQREQRQCERELTSSSGPRQTVSASDEHNKDLLFARPAACVATNSEAAATASPSGSAPGLSSAAGNQQFAHFGHFEAPSNGQLGQGGVVVAGPYSSYSPRAEVRLRPSGWALEDGGGAARDTSEAAEGQHAALQRSGLHWLPFSVRNAPLLDVIPKFYGVVETDGRTFLELEDLARNYRRPSIIDIKVGFRTWYPFASEAYIERCQAKDQSTTQASLGFKICGMQVYRHSQGGYWRASKRWCKTLPAELVDKALLSFAHNESGVRPVHVYCGAHGALAQLQSLESWFALQREFHFYSSSLLILYEGGATVGEDARVRVRFVDFAHTFKLDKGRHQHDHNFLAGLRAIIARLSAVMRAEAMDSLT